VVQLSELFSGGDTLSAVQINLRSVAVTRGGHGGLIDTVICVEKQRGCDDMLQVLFCLLQLQCVIRYCSSPIRNSLFLSPRAFSERREEPTGPRSPAGGRDM
jgi:hypothetical protein